MYWYPLLVFGVVAATKVAADEKLITLKDVEEIVQRATAPLQDRIVKLETKVGELEVQGKKQLNLIEEQRKAIRGYRSKLHQLDTVWKRQLKDKFARRTELVPDSVMTEDHTKQERNGSEGHLINHPKFSAIRQTDQTDHNPSERRRHITGQPILTKGKI